MAGCTQCGECCKKYGTRLEATALDIARWTLDGRQDILAHVGTGREGTEARDGVLWVGQDGRRASVCPFLELWEDGKFYCGIQEIKPEACTAHWCKNYLDHV